MRFPRETNQNNVFVMSPYEFKISTARTSMAQTITRDSPRDIQSITLPTPMGGLTLSESGNWDESAGFQHDLDPSSGKAIGEKMLAQKAIDQIGQFGNLYKKGEFINDYASLAFQGSNFREFSFNWVLIPDSLDEAQIIANIIKKIRLNALPDYSTATWVKYPKMWAVNPAAGSNLGWRLLDCVITNFEANYAPEGIMKTFNSGHPLSVEMSITFKELYRASKSDI